jgi:hypothetical protein
MSDLPTGIVYWRLFGRSGTTVGATPSPTWQLTVGARSAPINTSWGTTLDVNGDGFADLVVGAPFADSNHGQAYIYQGSKTGLPTTPTLTLSTPDPSGSFGGAVASAGDVNGDGFADVIIGAYVYFGGASGLSTTPMAIVSPAGANGFGAAVTSAGDLNGDGYADVAIGAPATSNITGSAYVYLGGPTGLAASPVLSLSGDTPGEYYGMAVASAGDTNGDGYEDLVVGAPGTPSTPGAGARRAYIFLGSATGPQATPSVTIDAPTTVTGVTTFGWAAAGADLDGDGYSDLVVGDAGAYAFVYPGGATGIGVDPSVTIYGGSTTGCEGNPSGFGTSISGAGDVNGDGYADLVIGSPYTDFQTLPAGSATVFLGSAAGIDLTNIVTMCGGIYDYLGTSVAIAGDTNGDGYADVAISSPFNGNAGEVSIYSGSASGVMYLANLGLVAPDGLNGEFGYAVY